MSGELQVSAEVSRNVGEVIHAGPRSGSGVLTSHLRREAIAEEHEEKYPVSSCMGAWGRTVVFRSKSSGRQWLSHSFANRPSRGPFAARTHKISKEATILAAFGGSECPKVQ